MSEETPATQLPAAAFTVELKNGQYFIRCKVCKAKWIWPERKLSIGAHLKLLDHAASHDT